MGSVGASSGTRPSSAVSASDGAAAVETDPREILKQQLETRYPDNAGVLMDSFEKLTQRYGRYDVEGQFKAYKPALDAAVAQYAQATGQTSSSAVEGFYKNFKQSAGSASTSMEALQKGGLNVGNTTTGNRTADGQSNGGVGAYEYTRNLEMWSTMSAANDVARRLGAAAPEKTAHVVTGQDAFGNMVFSDVAFKDLHTLTAPDSNSFKVDIGDFSTGADGKKIFKATVANPNDPSTPGAAIDVTEEQAKDLKDGKKVKFIVDGAEKELSSADLAAVNTQNTGRALKPDTTEQGKKDSQTAVILQSFSSMMLGNVYDAERASGGSLSHVDKDGNLPPSYWALAGRIYESHEMTGDDPVHSVVREKANYREEGTDEDAAAKLLKRFGVNYDEYAGDPTQTYQKLLPRMLLTTMTYFQPKETAGFMPDGVGEALTYVVPVIGSILQAYNGYKHKENWNNEVSAAAQNEEKMGGAPLIVDAVKNMQSWDLSAAKDAAIKQGAMGVGIDIAAMLLFCIPGCQGIGAAIKTSGSAAAKAVLETAAKVGIGSATKIGAEAIGKTAVKAIEKAGMQAAEKATLQAGAQKAAQKTGEFFTQWGTNAAVNPVSRFIFNSGAKIGSRDFFKDVALSTGLNYVATEGINAVQGGDVYLPGMRGEGQRQKTETKQQNALAAIPGGNILE